MITSTQLSFIMRGTEVRGGVRHLPFNSGFFQVTVLGLTLRFVVSFLTVDPPDEETNHGQSGVINLNQKEKIEWKYGLFGRKTSRVTK